MSFNKRGAVILTVLQHTQVPGLFCVWATAAYFLPTLPQLWLLGFFYRLRRRDSDRGWCLDLLFRCVSHLCHQDRFGASFRLATPTWDNININCDLDCGRPRGASSGTGELKIHVRFGTKFKRSANQPAHSAQPELGDLGRCHSVRVVRRTYARAYTRTTRVLADHAPTCVQSSVVANPLPGLVLVGNRWRR